MTSITDLSAHALSQLIATRDVSCLEVMQVFLERINALNPYLNALVNLAPEERCLSFATAADSALAAGNHQGWLHGIPVAIKDLANAEGFPSTFGSPLFENLIPPKDDPHVARMKAAGALVIGKTNVPEWGLGGHTHNALFGLTRNGRDPNLSAGGSSGGAASALAGNLLPLADGSDMMGSLRTPAAFQGVVGFRPTPNRVPISEEIDPFHLGLVSIGPMARSVADASALFSTMAGFESQAPTSPNSSSRNPVRVGWLGNAGGIWPMDDGLLDQCEQAVFQLHCPAFSIDHCLPPPQLAELWECWMTLRQHALSSGRLLFDDSAKRSLMGEPWCWEIEQGLTVTQSDITAAQATRSSWSETLVTLFERFDVIAAPACQVYPFKAEDGPPRQIASAALDTYHRWLAISLPASLGGLPVISLPISSPSSERTTGIQLMMPAGQDEALLALAESIEPILAA